MRSVTKRTLTHEELLDNKQTGKQNLTLDILLSTRYADRWEVCKRLFSKWSHAELAEEERERLSDKGQAKFYFKKSGLPGSVNFDVYPLPLNLDIDGRDKYNFPDRDLYEFPERTIDNVLDYPYINRTKFIIKETQASMFFNDNGTDPDIKYFMEMYLDFHHIMKYYKDTYFPDRVTDIVMNVIEYGVPFSTPEDNILQRQANALLWGKRHYDQNLMGLHLGEDADEFRLYNNVSDEWEEVGFGNNSTLLMWGDPEVTKLDWPGAFHAMVAPTKQFMGNTRYSIIIDLVPEDE